MRFWKKKPCQGQTWMSWPRRWLYDSMCGSACKDDFIRSKYKSRISISHSCVWRHFEAQGKVNGLNILRSWKRGIPGVVDGVIWSLQPRWSLLFNVCFRNGWSPNFLLQSGNKIFQIKHTKDIVKPAIHKSIIAYPNISYPIIYPINQSNYVLIYLPIHLWGFSLCIFHMSPSQVIIPSRTSWSSSEGFDPQKSFRVNNSGRHWHQIACFIQVLQVGVVLFKACFCKEMASSSNRKLPQPEEGSSQGTSALAEIKNVLLCFKQANWEVSRPSL